MIRALLATTALALAACATPADARPKPKPVSTVLVSCPDGSVVTAPATCPVAAPTPTPAPAPVVEPAPPPPPIEPMVVVVEPPPPPPLDPYASPSLEGAPDIETTDFDIHQAIKPANMPAVQAASEPVGAFRFICAHSHNNMDDPTVFPGQLGASHGHGFTGYKLTNAFSTYASIRAHGGSTCNDIAGDDKDPAKADWAGNRTPYWMPWVIDGKGNIIQEDYDQIYYKRWPIDSALCTAGLRQKQCLALPRGIKFVVKRIMPTAKSSGNFKFLALGVGEYTDFGATVAAAKTSVSHQLGIRGVGPPCWTGKQLDSPDHMSHLSYEVDSGLGYPKCPDSHPYRIPVFTWDRVITIGVDDDPLLIRLVSDTDPMQPRAYSAHFDYGPAAWPKFLIDMMENCFNKRMNASGGNLCNGFALKGAAQPIYLVNGVYTLLWHNPNRLVPIPMP